jgi:hypothetical protein
MVQKQTVYERMINPWVLQFNRLLKVAKDTETVKVVVLISSAISLLDFKAGDDFPCEDKDYNSQFFLLSVFWTRNLDHNYSSSFSNVGIAC